MDLIGLVRVADAAVVNRTRRVRGQEQQLALSVVGHQFVHAAAAGTDAGAAHRLAPYRGEVFDRRLCLVKFPELLVYFWRHLEFQRNAIVSGSNLGNSLAATHRDPKGLWSRNGTPCKGLPFFLSLFSK